MGDFFKNVGVAIIFAVAILLVVVLLSGCSTTRSVVKEFDVAGNIVKETVTTDSVVKELTASTAGKTVIVWENGWAAYLSISTATIEDPTPTGKMFAGKTAKGLISALPNQNWENLPEVIRATREDLNVSAQGISSENKKE